MSIELVPEETDDAGDIPTQRREQQGCVGGFVWACQSSQQFSKGLNNIYTRVNFVSFIIISLYLSGIKGYLMTKH